MVGTIETHITHETDQIDVEVCFEFFPGEPEVRYLSNGDPGHPATSPEIWITSVGAEGKEFADILSDTDRERIEELIIKKYESR